MLKLKILIAEDDRPVHEMYRIGLNPDLYDLKFVENGRDALDELKAWRPDIVLLDIMMPIMSGFVALKEIRRMDKENATKTPVIVTTSLSDKRDVMDCMKMGIQGYLIKPIKFTEVAEKIEATMSRGTGTGG